MKNEIVLNIKKYNKSKNKFLCFIILILFLAPLQVNGLDTAKDGTTGGNGYFPGCSASTKSCLIGMKGIRIKIVDENGEHIWGTRVINVIFSDAAAIRDTKYYYTWNDGTCSKLDYQNGDCDYDNGDIGGTDHTTLSETIIEPRIFLIYTRKLHDASLHSETATLSATDKLWNMDKLFTRFSFSDWANGSKNEHDDEVWKFLDSGLIDLEREIWEDSEEEVKNGTFIIIEPTALIRYKGEYYWGTAYELSRYYDTSQPNMPCLFGKYFPCTSYLKGLSAIESNKALGVNYSTKTYFNERLNWFSDVNSTQFSKTKKDSIIDICSPNSCSSQTSPLFSQDTVKGPVSLSPNIKYGTGMTVLWLGELNPPKVTCSEIDAYNPNLKSTIKREYDRGDLKFYVVTQPPIKYKTKDNVEKKVDLYWYTSECTCYGIIADYKEKTNVDLSTKTKNELQGIFNSSNVFDTLYNQLDKNSKDSDMYGEVTKWTYNKYNLLNCPYKNDPSIPPEPKYNCTPQFNVGNCSGWSDITYTDYNPTLSDEDYWKNCVYSDNGSYKINTHKQSKPNYKGSLSYYDNTLGGRYCEVYCTESLVTNFNANEIYVLAGQNFTWVDHSVNGGRTCKTKSIDWTSYESDIKTANDNVENEYIAWELEKLKPAAISGHTTSSSSSSCSCINSSHGVSCCTSASKKKECACGNAIEGKPASGCTGVGESRTCTIPAVPPVPDTMKCTCSNYTCDPGHRDYTRYDLYSTKTVQFKLSNGKSASWSTSWCSNRSTPTTDINGKYNSYQSALTTAKGITTEMSKCYTWNSSNIYNLKPEVSVSYSDNTYSYSGMLKTSTTYSSVQTSSDCKSITAPHYTGCSGTSCSTGTSMMKCTEYNATRSGTASFDYAQSGVFQYILKEGNKSIHTWELNNYKTTSTTPNYVNIGYSNFPVAYKTPSGVYGVGKANGGDLSLVYVKLGHMKNGSTYLDSILSSYDVDPNRDYSNWQCEFTVRSKLIPDTSTTNSGGINLIYRTIDLNNPFPGSKGAGRKVGSNWWYYNDDSNTNATVKEVITNNRKVTTDEVYNKDPMYSFELTPAMIKAIREYNKENSYASYAGSLNGESYDFVCKEGTGKNCISEYVSYLIEQSEATGTCVSNTTRNSSDVTSFEKCRY